MSDTKQCSKCGRVLPPTAFFTRRRRDGTLRGRGLTPQCRDCSRRDRARRYAREKQQPSTPVKREGVPLPTREEMRAWYEAGCRI